MGTSVIGNLDSQVWKLLGLDAEDKKDNSQKDSDENKENNNETKNVDNHEEGNTDE